MIINSLRIDEFGLNIDVSISMENSETITKILFWDTVTYKDPAQAIDLTYLTEGGETQTYVFSIPASAVGLEYYSKMFFIEFTSDAEENNVVLGVTSNFIKYYECLINKTLSIDSKGCEQLMQDCIDCESGFLFISVLLNTLNASILSGCYEEAIKILENLDDMCELCHECPQYEDVSLTHGLGFGTFDNSVILI